MIYNVTGENISTLLQFFYASAFSAYYNTHARRIILVGITCTALYDTANTKKKKKPYTCMPYTRTINRRYVYKCARVCVCVYRYCLPRNSLMWSISWWIRRIYAPAIAGRRSNNARAYACTLIRARARSLRVFIILFSTFFFFFFLPFG